MPIQVTESINYTELARRVADELGVSRREADRIVKTVLNVVTRTVASGVSVTVPNFGTWISYRTQSRKARNPQTGGTVHVAAYQAVKFRPSPRLTEAVRRRRTKATIGKLPKGQGVAK